MSIDRLCKIPNSQLFASRIHGWESMQSSNGTDGALVKCDQVAILGVDFPGLRIRTDLEEGDLVDAGEVLFRDRKKPDIAFVAPTNGKVLSIRHGAKRMFSRLVLKCSDTATNETNRAAAPDAQNREAVIAALTQNGFWTSFVTRPFGGMPDPNSRPDAIFVTATRTSRGAVDPRAVLEGKLDAFGRALDALAGLTDGPVYLCQDKGDDLLHVDRAKVNIAKFPEKPGLGLPGSHVHRLHPVGTGNTVWTIGYQDAAAIGHFLLTGHRDFIRTVAVSGSVGRKPQVFRVPQGAKLSDIAQSFSHTLDGTSRCFSGGLERGREAVFLGRYHDEVAFAETPGRNLLQQLLSRHSQPIIPHAGVDQALSMNLLAVPLMRALSVGDVETAQRLGCLELLEEDVAALTACCTSGTDYGRVLRGALDALKEAA